MVFLLISKIHAKRVPRAASSKKDPVPIIPEAQKRHPVPKPEAQKGTMSSGTSSVFPSMEVPPPPQELPLLFHYFYDR